MRVACVLLTHLRAKVEMRRHPHLNDTPSSSSTAIRRARDPWSSTASRRHPELLWV